MRYSYGIDNRRELWLDSRALAARESVRSLRTAVATYRRLAQGNTWDRDFYAVAAGIYKAALRRKEAAQ